MYSFPYRPGVGCLNGFVLIADVTKTVSPQTIGDDQPWPAMGTAHFTWSVVDQRSGIRETAGATPLMSWPRNPGHVSAALGPAPAVATPARTIHSSNVITRAVGITVSGNEEHIRQARSRPRRCAWIRQHW